MKAPATTNEVRLKPDTTSEVRLKPDTTYVPRFIINVMRFPSLVVSAAFAGVIWVGAQTSSTDRARHIMVTKVDPAALSIWRSVSATVTDQGVVERVPKNDKEWNDVRRAAELLADGGLMLKREPGEQQNREWLKWSQAIIDAAELTMKAVDAKSPERVFEAGEKIYDTCVACHGDYHVMAYQ